jgi:hypothetical protein
VFVVDNIEWFSHITISKYANLTSMEDVKYDCNKVGRITDIYALAKSMNIETLTKRGEKKAKRTLCSEINKVRDEYNWKIDDVAQDAEPYFDADMKQTMVLVRFQYFVDSYPMPAIDVLLIDHTEGDVVKQGDVEMIKVYWSGFKSATYEPVENVNRAAALSKQLPAKERRHEYTFINDYVGVLMYSMYVAFSKYKQFCAPINLFWSATETLLSAQIGDQTRPLHLTGPKRAFDYCLRKNSNVEIIWFLLTLTGAGGHSNILVYYTNDRVLELYDPHNETDPTYKPEVLYQDLRDMFSEPPFSVSKFVFPTNDYCVDLSVQALEQQGESHLEHRLQGIDPQGFCFAWSLMRLFKRLDTRRFTDVSELDRVMIAEMKQNAAAKKQSVLEYVSLWSRQLAFDAYTWIKQQLAQWKSADFTKKEISQFDSNWRTIVVAHRKHRAVDFDLEKCKEKRFKLRKQRPLTHEAHLEVEAISNKIRILQEQLDYLEKDSQFLAAEDFVVKLLLSLYNDLVENKSG